MRMLQPRLSHGADSGFRAWLPLTSRLGRHPGLLNRKHPYREDGRQRGKAADGPACGVGCRLFTGAAHGIDAFGGMPPIIRHHRLLICSGKTIAVPAAGSIHPVILLAPAVRAGCIGPTLYEVYLCNMKSTFVVFLLIC